MAVIVDVAGNRSGRLIVGKSYAGCGAGRAAALCAELSADKNSYW
jgi:hypothetical protein